METYKLSADEIMEKETDLALIAVGSIEQHGPHLPVMTDWAIATELLKLVSEKVNAFTLPALPISTCKEHLGKKGCVYMEPTTFYNMLKDIILCLKKQGFKKVAIIQCHGGIFIMNPLIRDLNAEFNPDLMVANIDICNTFSLLYEDGTLETSTELHAGEAETSQMLYIAPDTVKMEKAVDEVPSVPRYYLNYGSIFRASKSGIWGEPSYASAEKGKKILEKSADYVIDEMNKLFSYMENKEKFNYSDF